VSSGTAVTVEKNPKVLDVNTYDLEFEVDPMFRKTSAAFDDGGVEALLFTHLSVRCVHLTYI
jgi:condensin complex subunit 2